MNKIKICIVGALSIIVIGTSIYFAMPKSNGNKVVDNKPTIKRQIVNYKKPESIDKFYDEYFRVVTMRDPEILSYYGNLEKYGVKSINDELTDISDDYLKETIELNKKFLKDLRSYDKSNLTKNQKLSNEVLEWYLDDEIRGEKYAYNNYIVNQFNGAQSDLIDNMISLHNIESLKDAQNYVVKLSKINIKIDSIIDQVKIRENKGVIPPKYIIEQVINQISGMTNPKATDNELYKSFANKISQIKTINQSDSGKLCSDAEKEINDNIYPAYKKLSKAMNELKNKAPQEVGVWKTPNGDEYYEYVLRRNTTTNLKPEEIHNLGLKEVEKIQGELKNLFKEIGYDGDDLGTGIRKAYTSYYSGQESLNKLKEYVGEVDKKIPGMFNILPKTKLTLEPVPKFKEGFYPNAYLAGALDGSRPGIFYVNLAMGGCKETMKPLACHEGIPGHHLQLSIQNESNDIPIFRKSLNFTAFTEGWALYSEKLGDEYGIYDDANTKIGFLQSQLYRAGRLVVDTGIHYKKWTRQQAMDYMRINCAFNNPTEIDRYIVYPGQACSYMVGELKMLELREKAQKELGSKFNIKDFHNVVLKDGAMPLEILEKQVQNYIDDNKGK